MKNIDTIQIYVTGGTFDKDYNFITGELYFKDTHLKKMLETGRSSVPVDIKTLMMIDSLEMTLSEREIITYNIKRCPYDKVIVTHGTDTMTDTADFLQNDDIEGKTVVLTGAMIPFAFGTSSDGFFNIGSAMAFVQVLPPGIYVCMNGRYFKAGEVEKNRSTGYFQYRVSPST